MKKSRNSLLASSIGVALVFGATQGRLAHGASDASMADKYFVSEALKGGMAEVEMGQLAADKGSSEDVRKFGKKMVTDHTKLGDQMKEVASQIGVTPPTSPTMVQQVEIKKLKGLDAAHFDEEYIKEMVKDHQSDLKDFKKEADSGTSATVKQAASQGADMVSHHLMMIREIAKAHSISGE